MADNKSTTKAQNKKEQKESIVTKKYVILPKGRNHWEFELENQKPFVLSRTRSGYKHFYVFNQIPKEYKEFVERAVKMGVLDQTSNPEKYDKGEEEITKKSNPELKWKGYEVDQDENASAIKSPQLSTSSIKYTGNEKVYNLLQNNVDEIVKLLPTYLAKLNKKDAIDFLKEAVYAETKGYNNSAHPRPNLVDLFQTKLEEMGVEGNFITSVGVEEDTESDPEKVVKINL